LRKRSVIVGEGARKAQRDHIKPGGLRRQIKARHTRTAYDRSELAQCRFGQIVLLEKGVEAAKLSLMRQFDARNV
jgi:hypothetical protein